jgi:hypothetical protein
VLNKKSTEKDLHNLKSEEPVTLIACPNIVAVVIHKYRKGKIAPAKWQFAITKGNKDSRPHRIN